MHINMLTLRNYRNYIDLTLPLSKSINIFLGNNAQGKTNIIEAIHYAALGRSHRTTADAELIHWNAEESMARLSFERMGATSLLEFHFHRERRRQILHNGQNIRTKDLIGAINAVLFSPEDLFLIKGPPTGRRKFLDGEISQSSPPYYRELMKYNRILAQRNTLLKRIRERKMPRTMLETWDAQLADSAAKIITKRIEAVKKLNMLANLMQRRISTNEENLSLRYELHGQEQTVVTKGLVSWYNEKLKESTELDTLRGFTSIGPHRDDLLMDINGVSLRSFGSQGQQRTGMLALKLAELEFLRSETGEYPVLLLDDVMSELDMSRRKKLLDFILREHIQTLITATNEADFPPNCAGTHYDVKSGRVTRK